jgi:hypothetical protein
MNGFVNVTKRTISFIYTKQSTKAKLGHREDWGDYWRKEKIGEGLAEGDPKHILKCYVIWCFQSD